MLAIRLSRTGKIHAPHYRIVVQEKRSKLNGKTVDTIGHYHPASKDKLIVIDHAKATKWLGLGAQASDTVTNLLVKEGLLDASRKVHHFYTPVKKEEAPAPKAEVATPVAEAVSPEPTAEEVPAVELPAEAAPAVEEAPTEAAPTAEEASTEDSASEQSLPDDAAPVAPAVEEAPTE